MGFVLRYVPYQGDGGKGLTATEVADYHANGLPIAVVFESTQFRPMEGRSAGAADARTSLGAFRALGFPDDRPVYFAFDWDVQPADYAACDEYMRGAADILGVECVGVYGHDHLCAHFQQAGLATWFWQTLAWSGGRVFAGRHLYQATNGQTIFGSEVDFDDSYQDDFGQWPVEGELSQADKDNIAKLMKFACGDNTAALDAFIANVGDPASKGMIGAYESTNDELNNHENHHPGPAGALMSGGTVVIQNA
jgi:hypothetical protein